MTTTANGETVTMTREELIELLSEAARKEAKSWETAAPVVAAPAPIDLTDFDARRQHKGVVKQVMRFVKDGDGAAPHTYGQRQRLLALSDPRGPDFQNLLDSGMNRITAAVASHWLESGRPVKYGELVLVPRS